MRLALFVASASCCVLAGLPDLHAQSNANAIVVVYDALAPQARATRLLRSDLQLGTPLDLGRFPSDVFAPQAIAWDEISRDIILALQLPTGSQLVRLEWNGSAITSERVLCNLNEVVNALAVAANGDVFAVAPSGIWRVPRLGGSPSLIVAQRAASAISTYTGSGYALLANGRELTSGTEPGYSWVDLDQGVLASGPWQFVNFAGSTITGIIDLPTGLSREVMSDELGRITISEGFQDPALIGVSPQRGPGTTIAMYAADAFEPIVLGGAAHPWLESFTAFLQPNPMWTPRAGPFPAEPRDFCIVPAPAAAALPFGDRCGNGFASLFAPLPPTLGQTNFALNSSGFGSQVPLVLVLSTTDRNYFGILLPVELAPSCSLYVGLDSVLSMQSDAFGAASVSFAIPSWSFLAGSKVYAQALQLVPPMRFANALALHLQ